MKKFVVLAILVGFGVTASPAFGQATRTWVSGVGNDANPCSRDLPCKTFAGAIGKTAIGGIIDAMDDGGFGAVTITKSITIDGGGHAAGLLASGGINAVNINIAAGNPNDPERRVVLRGLSLEGQGTTLGLNGLSIAGNGAAEVELENVRIAQFSRNGIRVAPNTAFPSQLNMLLNNVVAVDNGPGDGSGGANGIEIRPTDASGRQVNMLIRNSVFRGNRPGPTAPAGDSGIGISADTGAHIWLTNTTVFDNQIGLKTFNRQGGSAGIIDSFCDNQIVGNVDGGVAPNLLCPQPAPGPTPPPIVETRTETRTETLTVTQCVVPGLKGLAVSFAKRLLKAANCALGRVTKKKARRRSQIGKVLSQTTRARTARPAGTKVNVTVGRR